MVKVDEALEMKPLAKVCSDVHMLPSVVRGMVVELFRR